MLTDHVQIIASKLFIPFFPTHFPLIFPLLYFLCTSLSWLSICSINMSMLLFFYYFPLLVLFPLLIPHFILVFVSTLYLSPFLFYIHIFLHSLFYLSPLLSTQDKCGYLAGYVHATFLCNLNKDGFPQEKKRKTTLTRMEISIILDASIY